MAGGLTPKNSIERLDWIKGSPNADAIQITIANTNPGTTVQRTTVTVTNAGTSGYTTSQLQNMIERITVFNDANGLFIAKGRTTANTLDYLGGSQDVIALVEFNIHSGMLVPAIADGYT